MKRVLCLLFCVLLCLPLFACANEKTVTFVMFPLAGRSILADEGAVFASSDETVATVDDSGLIVAVSPGKASVSVKQGSKRTTYKIEVLDPADYLTLYDAAKITIQNKDILQKVQDTMDALLLENATWQSTVEAAKKGDRMTISYTVSVNGKVVAETKGADETFILGSGDYVKGFEDALVGSKKGDQLTLQLPFPESYPDDPTLAGELAVFDVSVKQVELPIYPTFDNEFVKEHTKYQNVNEFDAQEYINAKASLAISAMVDRSTLKADPPKALYDHYFDQYVKRLETVLYYEYQKKVTGLSEILKLLDLTEKELRDSAYSQLAASVMQDCVFHTFMYQNKLTLSQEDFAKGTAQYVAENGYESLDDLLATSGLTLADIREVVLIDYLALRAAEMVKVEP